jgi:hypothetical protein
LCYSDALVTVVRHLVSGSPIMIVGLVTFALYSTLRGLTKRFLQSFTEQLPGLDSLQIQVIVSDAAERQAIKKTRDEAVLAH